MKNKKKGIGKKILACAGIALVAGAAGAGICGPIVASNLQDEYVPQVEGLTQTVIDLNNTVDTKTDEVENLAMALSDAKAGLVEKDAQIAEQEATITELTNVEPQSVDNEDTEKLNLIVSEIIENDGDVSDLDVDDLDEDEGDKLIERFVFKSDAKSLAIEAVKHSGVKELDKEELPGGDEIDEDDVKKFDVEDDFDDVEFDARDFDDQDADLILTADFEYDKVDYIATFEVKIRDGEVDDVKVVDIKEE